MEDPLQVVLAALVLSYQVEVEGLHWEALEEQVVLTLEVLEVLLLEEQVALEDQFLEELVEQADLH